MTTFADIKATSRLPEKPVPLCLRGDLQAMYETLERDYKKARAVGAGTLTGTTEEAESIKKEMDELREQMRESVREFLMRGLPRKKWRDLLADHKPREEDRLNRLDYNGETFPVAAVQACCIDPAMTVKEVEELCDDMLTQGQWDELFLAVLILNRTNIEVPT